MLSSWIRVGDHFGSRLKERPSWLRLRNRYRILRHRDPTARFCPCCETRVERFLNYGITNRPDAQCPKCFAIDRHRLTYLYMVERTAIFDRKPKRFLHVAPEPQMSRVLGRHTQIEYQSIDLQAGLALNQGDVSRLSFENGRFDYCYLSHVLEHVVDDQQAMNELHRVTKPGGTVLVQVPLFGEKTFEDPSAVTETQRLHSFGQSDHVRKYGFDIASRLSRAGFIVQPERFAQRLPKRLIRLYGILPEEVIFNCRVPPAAINHRKSPSW